MSKMQDITYRFPNEEVMAPGHLGCGGCGAALAMRLVLEVLGRQTVLVVPASCCSVIDGLAPYSAAGVPVMHTPYASAAAAASGVRAALDLKGDTETTVCAWTGDGTTLDIGIQALLAAAERNENILYVSYDNEAYLSPGVRHRSATPCDGWATTAPSAYSKDQPKKDLVAMLAAHGAPYVATATVAYPDDLLAKVARAKAMRGMRFLHVLAPCPPAWEIDSADTIKFGRLAVASHAFPLFEVVEGRLWRLTMRPKDIPLEEYLDGQGRFHSLVSDPVAVEAARGNVERRWQMVLEHTGR